MRRNRRAAVTRLALNLSRLSTDEIRARLAATAGQPRTPEIRDLVAACRRVLRHRVGRDVTSRYETRGVLAGAYVKLDDTRSCLLHVVEVDEEGRATRILCRRAKLDNIADGYADGDGAVEREPTCQDCRRRDPRRWPK